MVTRNKWRQLIGILSVIVITATSFPANVIAEGGTEEPSVTEETQGASSEEKKSDSENTGNTGNTETPASEEKQENTGNTSDNQTDNSEPETNQGNDNPTAETATAKVSISSESGSFVIGKTADTSSIRLKAAVSEYEGSYNLAWTGTNGISIQGADKETATVTGSKAGTAEVTVKVTSSDGMVLGTDTVEVKVWTDRAVSSRVYTDTPNNNSKATKKAYVGESLRWVIESSNDENDAESNYTFQWMKKENNAFSAIKNAVKESYSPKEPGTYKVVVSRSEGNYYHEFSFESEEVTVEKTPVTVSWESASREFVRGLKTFNYTGKSTVTAKDSVSGASYEKDSLSASINNKTFDISSAQVGTYTIHPANGLDAEKYDITDHGAEVKITKAVLAVTVKLSDKQFDNTEELKEDTEITITFDVDDLSKASLSAETTELVHEDGTPVTIQDFMISTKGQVDQDTDAKVSIRDGIKFFVKTQKGVSSNFGAEVTLSDIVIKKNEWTFEQVGELKEADGVVYRDSDGISWTKTGDDGASVEILAKDGFTLSDSLEGDYKESVQIRFGTEHTFTVYATDADGNIGQIVYDDVSIDNEAPEVDLEKSTYEVFGHQNRTNTYAVSDTGSGIKDIAYRISETEIDPAYSAGSTEWTHVQVPEKEDGKVELKLTVPTYGYVYFYLEDHLGNAEIRKLHMLVLEDGKPAVSMELKAEEVDASKASVQVTAEDKGSSGNNASGISYIEFALTDSEGRDVTDQASFLMDEKDGYVQNGTRVGFEEAPADIQSLSKYTKAEAGMQISGKDLEGTYTLTVKAVDFCGNVSESKSVDLVFDTKAPTVTVSMENGNQVGDTWYYNKNNCGVTLIFEDLNLSEGGTFRAVITDSADTAIEKEISTAELEDSTQASIRFSATEIAALADGTINISVTAVDANANSTKDITAIGTTASGTKAAFVLDTIAPQIISAKRQSAGKVNDKDIKKFIGSNNLAMTLVIEDENIDSKQFKGSSTKGKVGFMATAEGNQVTAVFAMTKGKYGYLLIDGTDYAGNVLTVSPTYEHGKYSVWTNTETGATTDSTYEIVTGEPAAHITYKNGVNDLEKRFVYGKDAYFNSSVASASVTLSNVEAEDYPYLSAALIAEGEDPETAEFKVFDSESMTFEFPADGAYYVLIKGSNRAMTPVTVQEQNLAGGEDLSAKQSSETKVYQSSYRLIRDTKAPRAVINLIPGEGTANTEINSEYGERYYFNKSFTAELTVSDIHLDEEASTVHFVQASAADYEDASTVTFASIDDYSSEIAGTYSAADNAGIFRTEITTDGVYSFAVYGEDLAGNAVILDSVQYADGSIAVNKEECNDKEANKSNIVVLDTVIPTGKIFVTAGEETVYEMTTEGQVSVLKPYINEKKVTVSALVDENEKTPVSISFMLNEKNKPADLPETSADYKVGQRVDLEAAASQVFTVSNLVITDLAGNSSAATPESRKLYLDTDIPDGEYGDAIAPLIQISANNASSYGDEGTPLFNGDRDVEFRITVVDPYEPDKSMEEDAAFSSSGLASVSWKLINTASGQELIPSSDLYKFDGTFYPTAEEAAKEVYTYSVNEKVVVSKDSYNYNTLKLVVEAYDNAGNHFEQDYAFGIDATAPEVTVSYEGGSAKSGNYFDGARKATVTVKERNFDPDKLKVVVTGDSEGSTVADAGVVTVPDEWTPASGNGQGNGDNDTYTKEITFNNNGHYTLHVSSADYGEDTAEDHVGNKGTVNYTGEAPTDFYIDTVGPTIKFVMALSENDKDPDGNYYYRADNCGVQVIFSDNGRLLGSSDGSVEKYMISVDGKNEKVFSDFGTGQSSIKLGYSADELAKDRLIEDGSHTITITAVDASGNRTTEVMADSKGANFAGSSNPGPTAQFILDTVNPAVTAVSTDAADGNSSNFSDLKVYEDTNSAYYNKNIRITLDVKDQYASSTAFSGAINSESGDAVNAAVSDQADGVAAVYSLKADSAYTGLTLTGKDKAGNPLVLDSSYDHEMCDSLNADNGTVKAVYDKVVDSKKPEVKIEYLSDDYANMYEGETDGKESAYYNSDITVKMSISDNYALDGKKITAGQGEEVSAISIPDNTASFSLDDVVITEDGRYTFTCSGTDRALNKTIVSEMIPQTDDAPEQTYLDGEETSAYVSRYELVLDKTAPTFVFDIKTDADVKNLSAQGNRYYFNAGYTATLTVTDVNFDPEKVELKKGSVKTGKYNSSTEIVETFTESVTSQTNVYVDEADTTNGVFRYVIFGSDKAGNALVAENTKNLDGTVNSAVDEETEVSRGSLEKEADASNHIVVDTVDPKGKVEVSKSASSDVYYSMDTDEQVSYAEPYRSETAAHILFTVDTAVERTPVKIYYQITSSTDTGAPSEYASSEYAYNASASKEQKGQQIFRISSYKLTDLAGNSVSCSSKNKIYLDVEPPVEDQLAPTINVSATAREECRDGNGQPLFNKDVPIRIVVEDKHQNASSSGLADITYEMYINGSSEPVKGETQTLHAAAQKKHESAYDDAELDYKLDRTITVDSKSHNYNNLRVVVKATDNAGNVSSKEYRFGIDITKPTISVDYDNNSAQNGKYFKANRVATVVVKERNFDSSLIKITTEGGAAISGWKHTRANDSNGDGDTWSCTITYSRDGNYHLTLAGSDMVGWQAENISYKGTAPRDFVIDKTAPRVVVSYDNNSVQNGKYYKDSRTATATVTDVNFNGANAIKISASGGGTAPGVRFNGKTASMPFTSDGVYKITGTVTDMAGNVSNVLNEAEFVIDKTAPEISLSGVKDLSANNVPLNITLKMVDTNYNPDGFEPVLKGTNHGRVAISGEPKYVDDGITYVLEEIKVDDYYELVYTATDLAGNTSEMKVSFSENQNGTSFKFVQDEYNGKATNKTFNPEFILSNIDEITIMSVTLNGKETPYTFKNNHLVLNTKTDTDGKYTITIDTKDAAGNLTSMDPVEFQIDTKAPVLTVDGLNGKAKYYFDEFNLTFYHDNPDDIFSVIKMNGIDLDQSEYTVNDDGSITIHIGQYQDYDIEIQVSDAAGNVSEFENIRFTMTRNPFIRWYTNTPLFLLSLVVLTAIIVWLILLWKRRKDEDEEEEGASA